MLGMDEPMLKGLGHRVTDERRRAGLAKEAAARLIEVSSITLKRVEDGLPVREDSLAKVLGFFAIPYPEGDSGSDVAAFIRDSRLSPKVKEHLLRVLEDEPDEPPAEPRKPRKTG